MSSRLGCGWAGAADGAGRGRIGARQSHGRISADGLAVFVYFGRDLQEGPSSGTRAIYSAGQAARRKRECRLRVRLGTWRLRVKAVFDASCSLQFVDPWAVVVPFTEESNRQV